MTGMLGKPYPKINSLWKRDFENHICKMKYVNIDDYEKHTGDKIV